MIFTRWRLMLPKIASPMRSRTRYIARMGYWISGTSNGFFCFSMGSNASMARIA